MRPMRFSRVVLVALVALVVGVAVYRRLAMEKHRQAFEQRYP